MTLHIWFIDRAAGGGAGGAPTLYINASEELHPLRPSPHSFLIV